MSNHDPLTDLRDGLQNVAQSLPGVAQDPRMLRAAAYHLQALAESVHAIADAGPAEPEVRTTWVWAEANPMPRIGSHVRCLCALRKRTIGAVVRIDPGDSKDPSRDLPGIPVIAWVPSGETDLAETCIFPEGEGRVWARIP